MASKIKKALKKIGKAALVAGAGYAAMKGLKNRKENKDFLKTEGGDKSDMRDYGPFSKGKNPQASPSKYVASKTVLGKKGINRMDDGNFYQGAKNGGRMGLKSGGKSTPKSIGKALRGGGKVMR
jgi:hypothetical protein